MRGENALDRLIEQAIEEERRSEALYRRAGEMTQDEEARRFLLALADEERLHARELIELRERSAGLDEVALPDEIVAGLEHSIHGANGDDALSGIESIRDVLLLALKREHRASSLYRQVAEWAEDEAVQTLFARFAHCEDGHYHRVREHFRNELDH